MTFERLRFFPALGVALLAACVTVPAAHAQGNAGAASLQIPPGARAEGMGRTFAAIADDAFAPWWNPGGLAFLEGRNAALMHAQLVPDLANDVYFEYASYAQHVAGWGGVAFTVTYLNYGKSIETRAGSAEPVGEFTSFEIAPSLAIGTQVSSALGLGANLKFVHVDLAPATVGSDNSPGKGSTFAVDMGALYRVPGKPLNLAAVVQNIGPDIGLVDENQSDPLPRTLRLGAAFQIINKPQHSLVAAFDGDKVLLSNSVEGCEDTNPADGKCDNDINRDVPVVDQTWLDRNNILWNVGGEYTYNNLVSIRAGYIYDDPGEIKDMTYGLGVTYKGISFDYASIPQYTELDRVSKFSLSARF